MNTQTAPECYRPSIRWCQWAVAFVWLATGVLVVHPQYRTIGGEYLGRLGLPSWPMYATCVGEIILGLWIALRPPSTAITALQVVLIGGFTVLLVVAEPMLLVHPFGVLSKNVPMVALIVWIWLSHRAGWTPQTEWLLRAGMAVVWLTEGLFPKILFQQQLEIDVVRNLGISATVASLVITGVGVCQFLSGVAVLLVRGRPLSLLLSLQILAMLCLPFLVIAHDPLTLVHPFGPHIKNVPMIVGTAVVLLRKTPFLAATWSNLLLVTYAVPAEVLRPRLPSGVELDTRNGQAFLSFVSLDFSRVRILGLAVPGFRRFPDINLRFYVRCDNRRGVVFVRELVPLRLVAWVARTLYHEPFDWAPIRSTVQGSDAELALERTFDRGGRTHSIRARADRQAVVPSEDSAAHYFKERYWGFGRSASGHTVQYQVEHPVWAVQPIRSWSVDIDWSVVYGPEWQFLRDQPPVSVEWATGSAVRVWLTV